VLIVALGLVEEVDVMLVVAVVLVIVFAVMSTFRPEMGDRASKLSYWFKDYL